MLSSQGHHGIGVALVHNYGLGIPLLSVLVRTWVKDLKFRGRAPVAPPRAATGAFCSPFFVPSSWIKVHQQLRALEEVAKLASTATLAKCQATRTWHAPCPRDNYHSVMEMLLYAAYIELLMMLFGSACKHVMNVTSIY